jgi:hypothetical protein
LYQKGCGISESKSIDSDRTTSNGRDDADFVGGLNGCVQIVEESDVFVVDIYVHESAQLFAIEQTRT